MMMTKVLMMLGVLAAVSAAHAKRGIASTEDGVTFTPVNEIPIAKMFMAESYAGSFQRESHSEALQGINVYEFADAKTATEVNEFLCEEKAAAIIENFPSTEKKKGFTDISESKDRKFCLLSVMNTRPNSMHKERLLAAGFVNGKLYVVEASFTRAAKPAERQEFQYFLETLK